MLNQTVMGRPAPQKNSHLHSCAALLNTQLPSAVVVLSPPRSIAGNDILYEDIAGCLHPTPTDPLPLRSSIAPSPANVQNFRDSKFNHLEAQHNSWEKTKTQTQFTVTLDMGRPGVPNLFLPCTPSAFRQMNMHPFCISPDKHVPLQHSDK